MVGYGVDRYERHLKLADFDSHTQQRIREARVVVVGAGGLGSPVLLYLAAAGIGELISVDNDVVSVSNLHRQVIHSSSRVNQLKVDSVRDKLADLNPEVRTTPVSERLTFESASELFRDASLVVDCTDNFETRFLIDDVCDALGVPVVWGSVSGYYGQVSLFPHTDSRGATTDSGAEQDAQQLVAAQRMSTPSLRTLFPDLKLDDGDAVLPEPPEKTGTFGPLCGVVGSMMANEALKYIGGIGRPLIGRVLLIDTLSASMREVAISLPDESCGARKAENKR